MVSVSILAIDSLLSKLRHFECNHEYYIFSTLYKHKFTYNISLIHSGLQWFDRWSVLLYQLLHFPPLKRILSWNLACRWDIHKKLGILLHHLVFALPGEFWSSLRVPTYLYDGNTTLLLKCLISWSIISTGSSTIWSCMLTFISQEEW